MSGPPASSGSSATPPGTSAVWPVCSATAKASLERTVRELLAARELSFDEGGAYYTRDARARIWDDVAVVSPGHEHYQEQARPWADASQRVRCDLVDLQVLAAGGLGVTVLIMRNREEAGDGYMFDSFLRRLGTWWCAGICPTATRWPN